MIPSLTTSKLQFSISLLFLFVSVAQAQPCSPAIRGLGASFSFEEASPLRIKGKVGNGRSFNGKNQFLELPAKTKGIDFGSEDFSISLWLRTSDGNSIKSIVDKRDTSPKGYLIFVQNGRIAFQVTNGGERTEIFANGISIADNRWHHIVAMAKRLPPQAPRLFVDGKLAKAPGKNSTIENIDNPVPLWLGRHHRNRYVDTDEEYYRGDLDELYFFRRALSPEEVSTLHTSGLAGKCTSQK